MATAVLAAADLRGGTGAWIAGAGAGAGARPAGAAADDAGWGTTATGLTADIAETGAAAAGAVEVLGARLADNTVGGCADRAAAGGGRAGTRAKATGFADDSGALPLAGGLAGGPSPGGVASCRWTGRAGTLPETSGIFSDGGGTSGFFSDGGGGGDGGGPSVASTISADSSSISA
jgi:hypothetical protein